MTLGHLGIAVTAVGVSLSTVYSDEHDIRMVPGDTKQLGGYTFRLEDIREREGPNYSASVGVVRVTKDGRDVAVLKPENRIYRVRRNVMTEAAIDPGLSRDIYVSLGESVDKQTRAWSIRLYHKPFVRWIWLGGIFMALGGLLAATDRRYLAAARKRLEKQRDLLTSPAVG